MALAQSDLDLGPELLRPRGVKVTLEGGAPGRAFTEDEQQRLLLIDENYRAYRLRLTRFAQMEALLRERAAHLEGIIEAHKTKFDALQIRFDQKAEYVNQLIVEKNKYKHQRRWAGLWKPLGLGTILTSVALGCAIAR